MRVVSSFILFILLTMIAEDAVSAHATPQNDSAQIISALIDSQHDHSPLQNCETNSHRDSSHFGHCSFLLVIPINDLQHIQPLNSNATFYFFSLKINSVSSLLRPPIYS